MAAEKSVPRLKLEEIKLPSDRVTCGEFRREQPGCFEGDPIDWNSLNIYATIATEVDLARRAHAKAAGHPEMTLSTLSRQELISGLNRDYKRYGLSSGLEATKQLVRDIENAAAAQAHEHAR